MINSLLKSLDVHSIIHEDMFDDDAHLFDDEPFHSCSCGHNLSEEQAEFIGYQETGHSKRKPLKLYNCPFCHTTFSKK